eukprot:1374168-Amorphochlora_amoeboformis.AAC.1
MTAQFKSAGMEALLAEMNGRLDVVKQGGGEKYVAKHKARKKLLARERIDTVSLSTLQDLNPCPSLVAVINHLYIEKFGLLLAFGPWVAVPRALSVCR